MREPGEGGGGSFWVTFWLRRASFWGSRQRPQSWGGEPGGTRRDLGARPASAGRLLLRTLFPDTLPPHPFPLWRSPQVDDPSPSGRPPAWAQGCGLCRCWCPGVPRPASSLLVVTARLPGAEGQASPSPPLLHGSQFWVFGVRAPSSPLAAPPRALRLCLHVGAASSTRTIRSSNFEGNMSGLHHPCSESFDNFCWFFPGLRSVRVSAASWMDFGSFCFPGKLSRLGEIFPRVLCSCTRCSVSPPSGCPVARHLLP